jgi:hypothetical protein
MSEDASVDWERLIDETNLATCEGCRVVNQSVALRPCRTSYADPSQNHSPRLCDECASEYNDYWDSLWADYYGGQR